MNDISTTFLSEEEQKLTAEFVQNGYVIVDVEDGAALRAIREKIVAVGSEHLNKDVSNEEDFLNSIHSDVSVRDLNQLRLSIFNAFNDEAWARPAYFSLCKSALGALVGNELAMQKRVNLSIQLPNDDSSLLPVHSDVWSGDSPFEVVVWLPLVDCYKTKSMFILSPEANEKHAASMHTFKNKSFAEFYKSIESDLKWLDVKFGQALIFSHTLMHGNIVNTESEARWSMNCRFKSLLSPYSSKRLGEFFEPIIIRPATRIGMEYDLPSGFSDE